jgi:hypothetical protein
MYHYDGQFENSVAAFEFVFFPLQPPPPPLSPFPRQCYENNCSTSPFRAQIR